jgi:hypothetical protein
VIKELFDRLISEVKVEVAGMCFFLVFVCLFMFLYLLIISRFCIYEHRSNVLVFLLQMLQP